MNEIKAYFRPVFVDPVVDALERSGAADVMGIRVDALGRLADVTTDAHHLVRKFRGKHSDVVNLELVCQDEDAPRFVEVIRQTTHTGEHGNGRVFASGSDGSLNNRTGVNGIAAL